MGFCTILCIICVCFGGKFMEMIVDDEWGENIAKVRMMQNWM